MPVVALIWGAITSKIAGPVAIALAIALLAWGVVERVQLAAARLTARQAQAAQALAKADLSICSGNLTVEKQAEATQEAAVLSLKARADQTDAALTKAASAAQSARAAAEAQVRRIEAMRPPGDHACPAVDAVILGGSS